MIVVNEKGMTSHERKELLQHLIHPTYRDIINDALVTHFAFPERWGCMEDGVWILSLLHRLESMGSNTVKDEYHPLHNPRLICNSLQHYFDIEEEAENDR